MPRCGYVAKPHFFNDNKDVKEPNYLWHIEHYFETTTPIDEQVKL